MLILGISIFCRIPWEFDFEIFRKILKIRGWSLFAGANFSYTLDYTIYCFFRRQMASIRLI